MSNRRVASMAFCLTCFFAAGVHGQTITDSAQGIESRIAADDFSSAIVASRDLLGMVWDMTPNLGFSEVALVDAPASGYGIYNLRPTTNFKAGESIYVYAEPYGYGFGTPGSGLYSIGFFVDLRVVAADGTVLGEVPDVAELDLTSRVQNREFQATITYDLSGIEPGSYVLVTSLRDKNSPKSGSFETPIEIVP
jgi:hypothetical protein